MDVRVTPVKYEVSVLPLDFEDGYLWTINVEYRGNDLWAIMHRVGNVYGKNGTWSHEHVPGERTDEWLEEYRWPLEEALEKAKELAPGLKFHGMSPEDLLAGKTP
jgi:hypothetical protein